MSDVHNYPSNEPPLASPAPQLDSSPLPMGEPRARQGLLLPIVAGLVLVVGLGLAVAGMLARHEAQESTDEATAALFTMTASRDEGLAGLATATEAARDASIDRDSSSKEGVAVRDLGVVSIMLADQLVACSQQAVDAMVEHLAALDVDDFNGADRAIDSYNAAVDDCNEFTPAFDDSVTELHLAPSDDRQVQGA